MDVIERERWYKEKESKNRSSELEVVDVCKRIYKSKHVFPVGRAAKRHKDQTLRALSLARHLQYLCRLETSRNKRPPCCHNGEHPVLTVMSWTCRDQDLISTSTWEPWTFFNTTERMKKSVYSRHFNAFKIVLTSVLQCSTSALCWKEPTLKMVSIIKTDVA